MTIRGRNHDEVEASIRDTVPAQPGVYLFVNKAGEVLYVGKSVNLRSRMLSYFRWRHDKVETRTGQMIHGIETFDFFATRTELQALLIEDELIKRELPRYNIRQKEFDENRYLLLTCDPYPALKTIEDQQSDIDGVLFGPFKDKYFTTRLLDFICHHFHFRACTDQVPCEKCVSYDIGACAGPCRNTVSEKDYGVITERVTGFLHGDDSHATATIEGELEAAVAGRHYERAAALRDQLQFCQRFCSRQRFIHRFETSKLVIMEGEVEHLFDRGRWITGRDQPTNREQQLATESDLDIEAASDIRFMRDRANVVYTWLNGNAAICEYQFL